MQLIGLAVVLVVSLVLAPLGAGAQPATTPRIGFLCESWQPWDEGFLQGLRELGYAASSSEQQSEFTNSCNLLMRDEDQ